MGDGSAKAEHAGLARKSVPADRGPALRYVFEWDPAKDLCNRAKHGIRFRQATFVFRDPLAVSLYDDEHSLDEDRWATVGTAGTGSILVVNHTFRKTDEGEAVVRIFSARSATRRERRQYEEGR